MAKNIVITDKLSYLEIKQGNDIIASIEKSGLILKNFGENDDKIRFIKDEKTVLTLSFDDILTPSAATVQLLIATLETYLVQTITASITSSLTNPVYVQEVSSSANTEVDANNVLYVHEVSASTAASTPSVTHRSPVDFTVAIGSGTTLVLSGLPDSITSDAQVKYIYASSTGSNTTITMYNGVNNVNFQTSASILTVNGASTALTSYDSFEVGISFQDKAYDLSLDIQKTIDQSPIYTKYTTPEQVITAAQGLYDTWKDIGSEIDVRGYTNLVSYITVDINGAANVRYKALGKHTSAGADEFDFAIETISSSDIKVEPQYIEFNTDADQKLVVNMDVSFIPYIQLQVMSETTGAADFSTSGSISDLYISKGWK